MLIAKNLLKSYEDVDVLRGIDLQIPPSSITCITGKSGAGKSTLLHILGSLDLPDTGEVILDGQSYTSMSKSSLAAFRNERIGFVFQFHHLLPEFSALENVCIPAFIKKVAKKEAEKEAEKLLEYMGLSNRIHHKPSELSGGEQQRVAVARSLINRPLVVFADEPTGNLDNQTSTELHELFTTLQTEMGQAFVIVTHNNELAQKSDRCLEMSDGKIVEG